MRAIWLTVSGYAHETSVALECAGHQWVEAIVRAGFAGVLLHFVEHDVVARTLSDDGAQNSVAALAAYELDAAVDGQQFRGDWLLLAVDEENRVCDMGKAQCMLWLQALGAWRQDIATGAVCRHCLSEMCECYEFN